MKFWTDCRDFLRIYGVSRELRFAGIAFVLILSIVFSTSALYFSIRASRSDHVLPGSGAVEIGQGVFCTVDGRSWWPAHEIGEGNYVCFLPSDDRGEPQ